MANINDTIESNEPEFLSINIIKLTDNGSVHTDFGFNIVGGSDRPPYIPGYKGIFVSAIKKNGLVDVDGRLRVGDRIISINDIELNDKPHGEAVRILRESVGLCRLVVEPNAEFKCISDSRYLPNSTFSPSNLNEKGTMSFLSDSSLPSSSASTQSGSYSRGRLNKDSTISTFTADETLMGEETQSIISEPASIVDSGNSTKTQLSKGTKKAEDVGNFFERHAFLTETLFLFLGTAAVATGIYFAYKRYKH